MFDKLKKSVSRILGLANYDLERNLVRCYTTLLQIFAEDIKAEFGVNTTHAVNLFNSSIYIFAVTSQIEESYYKNSRIESIKSQLNELVDYYNKTRELKVDLTVEYCDNLISYCREARKASW